MGCCGSRDKDKFKNKCDDILIEKKIEIKREANENIGFGVLYSVACVTTSIIASVCRNPHAHRDRAFIGQSKFCTANSLHKLC